MKTSSPGAAGKKKENAPSFAPLRGPVQNTKGNNNKNQGLKKKNTAETKAAAGMKKNVPSPEEEDEDI